MGILRANGFVNGLFLIALSLAAYHLNVMLRLSSTARLINNISRNFAGAQKSCLVKVEYFFVSYSIKILHGIMLLNGGKLNSIKHVR
jgi:hypothetical protein